jgi:hypothetical protein
MRALPLPPPRGLTKQQAAEYLGIGITLLSQIGPAPIKIGRRCIYDTVDLDQWLDDYKRRGRASKEALWPEKEDSTDARTRPSGGSTWSSRTDVAYAEALGFRTSDRRKST